MLEMEVDTETETETEIMTESEDEDTERICAVVHAAHAPSRLSAVGCRLSGDPAGQTSVCDCQIAKIKSGGKRKEL